MPTAHVPGRRRLIMQDPGFLFSSRRPRLSSLRSLAALICVPIFLAIGCATSATLPPSYFADRAPALAKGKVAITGAAGGGGEVSGGGGGAGARVRVGIGARQELGVEGSAVAINSPANVCVVECEHSDPD